MNFTLDHRLQHDTLPLAESDFFLTLLVNDQRFPWVIVVPKFNNISEIYELTVPVQQALSTFSLKLGQNMMNHFHGDSLNTAAIGNVVKQLHIHHVVRYINDSAWPGPVWGSGEPIWYPESKVEKLLSSLPAKLLQDV